MLSILLAASVLAQAPKYGACNVEDAKALVNRSIPIVPALTGSVIKVSGSIFIIDGCNFGVRDFVFINGDESYWYGGYKGSSDGFTLSQQYIYASANPSTQRFPLVQTAGAQTNFNGFNEFRLFSKNLNLVVATADMSAIGAAPATAERKNASPTQSAANGQESTTTSSAFALAGGLWEYLSLAVAFLV